MKAETKKKPKKNAHRNARVRGKQHERRVASALCDWWDPEKKWAWKRTPSSGGSPLKDGWDLAGDICTNCPSFPFHVEAKNDKSWECLTKGLGTPSWPLWKWVKQADGDCPRHRYPILLFASMSGRDVFVAFWRPSRLRALLEQAGVACWTLMGEPALRACGGALQVVRLTDFLRVGPDAARKAVLQRMPVKSSGSGSVDTSRPGLAREVVTSEPARALAGRTEAS